METTARCIDRLQTMINRYDRQKQHFNNFQETLRREVSGNQQFPIQGITVATITDTRSDVSFQGRKLGITFKISSDMEGKIEVWALSDPEINPEIRLLSSVTYTRTGFLNLPPQNDEDALNITDVNTQIQLLLNWLLLHVTGEPQRELLQT